MKCLIQYNYGHAVHFVRSGSLSHRFSKSLLLAKIYRVININFDIYFINLVYHALHVLCKVRMLIVWGAICLKSDYFA